MRIQQDPFISIDAMTPDELKNGGAAFQFNVWQSLLTIPKDELSTYGELANKIGKPKACRAVGSAIRRNAIAFIIPCHHVIQTSGSLGGYRWGIARKSALLIGKQQAPANSICKKTYLIIH